MSGKEPLIGTGPCTGGKKGDHEGLDGKRTSATSRRGEGSSSLELGKVQQWHIKSEGRCEYQRGEASSSTDGWVSGSE